MMKETLLKKDRKIRSGSWQNTKKYSKFDYIDLQSCPHTTSSYFFLEEIIIMIAQLSIINTQIRSPNGLATIGHEYVHLFLRTKIVFSILDPLYTTLLLQLLFLASLIKIGIIIALVNKNRNGEEPTQSSKFLIHTYSLVSFLSLTIFLLPSTELCIIAVKYNWWLNILQASLVTCMVPFDLFVHTLVTFDFRFSRRNILQGRNYSYFRLRVLGMWFLGFFSILLRGHAELSLPQNILNGLHIAFGILQMYHKNTVDIYQEFHSMNILTTISNTFYLWECTILSLDKIAPQLTFYLDLDMQTVVMVPVLVWLNINLSEIKKRKVLYLTPELLKHSADQATYFFEVMIACYNNQKSESNLLQLYTSVISHSKYCSNPMCMCFLLRYCSDSEKADGETGGLSDVVSKFISQENQKKNKNLVLLSDSTEIEKIRKEHFQMVTAKHNLKKDLVLIERSFSDPHIKKYDISLESRDSFLLFVGSVFNTMIVTFEGRNFFEIAMGNLRFLIHEYHNPLSAMLFAYNYIYSKRYETENSLSRDIYLQNVLNICKRNYMSEQDASYRSYFQKMDIGGIMDYRLRVDCLMLTVDDLIKQKVDLYDILSKSRVDYKMMINISEKLYDETQRVQKEIDHLISVKGTNSKLLKCASRFELIVQERRRLSKKLRSYYGEVINESKTNTGIVQSEVSKSKFNVLHSSNSVIFCRYQNGGFKVVDHSQNALSIFGMDYNHPELRGSLLSRFMCEEISQVHDKMMIGYLNGQSNLSANGKVKTMIIGADSYCRSVIILPKINCLLTEEVYIGGLISPRLKNALPMLYVDRKGTILATNSEAEEFLSVDNYLMSDSSLFLMMPRLVKIFYPVKDMKTIRETDSIESRIEDENKDLNFENNFMSSRMGNRKESLVESIDVSMYLFQIFSNFMNSKTGDNWDLKKKESIELNDRTQILEKINPDFVAGKDKVNLQTEMEGKRIEYSKLLENIKNVFSSNADRILMNPMSTFKLRSSLEKFTFSNDLVFYEICLQNLSNSDKVSNTFFKLTLKQRCDNLFEHLCVQPETIEYLVQMCNLTQNISKYMGDSEKPLSIIRKIMDKRFRSRNERVVMRADGQKETIRLVVNDEGEKFKMHQNSPSGFEFSESSNPEVGLKFEIGIEKIMENVSKVPNLRIKVIDILDDLLRTNTNQEIYSLIEFFFENIFGSDTKKNLRTNSRIESLMLEEKGFAEGNINLNQSSLQVDDNPSSKNMLGTQRNEENKTNDFMLQSTAIASNSTKHSFTSQKITIVRTKIEAVRSGLLYKGYEVVMLVFCFLLIIMRLSIKLSEVELGKQMFSIIKSIRVITRTISPVGFAYKETIKCRANQTLGIDESKLYSNQVFFANHLKKELDGIQKETQNSKTESFKMKSSYEISFWIDSFMIKSTLQSLSTVQYFEFLKLYNQFQTTGMKTTTSILAECEKLNYLSSEEHNFLSEILKELIERRDAARKKLDTYSTLNLVGTVLQMTNLIVFILLIVRSFGKQLSKEASLLLEVHKDKYDMSFKRLIPCIAKNIEMDQTTEKGNTITRGLATLKQTSIQKSPDYKKTKKLNTRALAQNEKKKKGTIFKPKKVDSGTQQSQRMLHSSSSFVNFNQSTSYAKSIVKVLIFLSLISLPGIIEAITQKLNSAGEESKIHHLDTLNSVIGRVQILAGLVFELRLSLSFNDANKLKNLNNRIDQNLEVLSTSKNNENHDIMNKLVQSIICRSIIEDAYYEGEKSLCDTAFFMGDEVSIFRALREYENSVEDQVRETNTLYEQGSPSSPSSIRDYFESKRFVSTDLMADYLSLGLEKVVEQYSNEISMQSDYNKGMRAYSLLFIEVCLLISFVVGYKVWWAEGFIKRVNRLRCVYISMNDDILSDPYIISYFG